MIFSHIDPTTGGAVSPQEIVAADGGIMGHYRRVARQFVRYYQQVVRPAIQGLPAEVPQDVLGVVLGKTFVNPTQGQRSPERQLELDEVGHWMLTWRQMGAPTFQLSHSVTAALLLTDPSNVRYEDVPWPYDSFAILLPSPQGPIVFTDTAGKDVAARCVVVHRYLAPKVRIQEYQQKLLDRVAQMRAEVSRRGTSVPTYFNCHGLSAKDVENGEAHYHTHIRVMSDTGVSLFNSSHWPWAGPDTAEKVDVWLDTDQGVDYVPLNREDKDAVKAALRLVVNLAIYLATLRENKRPCEKRRRGADAAKEEPGYDLYDVPLVDPESGTVIKLDPAVRDAAAGWCREGRDPTRWKLQSRIAVVGHWKQVPYGPMKIEGAPEGWVRPKRRKWIAPYKRGPEATETVAKTYKADGPKERRSAGRSSRRSSSAASVKTLRRLTPGTRS